MAIAWPFGDPPNTIAVTTRQMLEQGLPILLVTHDADDGCWQMLCGTTNDTEDARVVGLGTMYKQDPSVSQLADLPLGWRAWRPNTESPWVRKQIS
jgi:hypothetical protein